MKPTLKQKALRSLAHTPGEAAEVSIRREVEKIAAILKGSDSFNELESSLELLDVIAFRAAGRACEVLTEFLGILLDLKLRYEEVPGFSAEALNRIQNKEALIVKVLKVLEHIRYFEPKTVLDVFLEYSLSQKDSIAKQAQHGLTALAQFELDVVHGTEQWKGLGVSPQSQVLERIESLPSAKKKVYFSGIIEACNQILSPTMQSTSLADYRTVTWTTAAVPPGKSMQAIRERALTLLQELYTITETIAQKRHALRAMNQATRMPHTRSNDQTREMIADNTVVVLKFWASLVPSENLEIVQTIEHDAYWIFYHRTAQRVRDEALKIKTALDEHNEYQIFKLLIGYEGIFREWKTNENGDTVASSEAISEESELRERGVGELADSVSTKNFEIWQARILAYSKIESQDLATFPYFGKFLQRMSKNVPDIALRLLKENAQELERFFTPIFIGLWETPERQDAEQLISEWIAAGEYTRAAARVFEYNDDADNPLFRAIFERAVVDNDRDALIQIVAATVANYGVGKDYLVRELFLPALRALTLDSDARWVFQCWYRKQLVPMLSSLDADERGDVLQNLLSLDRIDYHAEEIIYPLALESPAMVLGFFCDRLSTEKSKDHFVYEAIPFEFHKLSAPLARRPKDSIQVIARRYNDNYGRFSLEEGRLVKNIFPDFPPEFERELVELVQTNEARNVEIVMAILRNYDGAIEIHNVCKEIVKILPPDSKELSEVEAILESTGVVHGEFGFADTYEGRLREIEPWITDKDERVRAFAGRFSERLSRRAAAERERAEEEIEVRKRRYGDRGEHGE